MNAFVETIRRAVATRYDAWANTLTQVGISLGKSAMSFRLTTNDILDSTTLEYLYTYDGLAATIVDSVPEHALRQGYKVKTGDEAQEASFDEEIKRLNLIKLPQNGWTWGRLHGGGGLYLNVDDGRLQDEPIDFANLRRVNWILDFDKRDVSTLEYETDPRLITFGTPRIYQLQRLGGSATQTLRVHASRIVRFEGVTPTRRRRIQLDGWGESVLQRVYSELQQARAAFAASGTLLQEASRGVIKIKGLAEAMAGDGEDLFKRRLALMEQATSIANSMLLDADGEDYTRIETGALSGLVDVLDRNINLLAGVSRIPVTVLLGQAPAGLNATGDSDIRNWYDDVAAKRERHCKPQLQKIFTIVARSKEGPTGGVVPDRLEVVFPSLWQPTENEKADLRDKQARVDQVYLNTGVLRPDEVRESRFRSDGWNAETVTTELVQTAATPTTSTDAASAPQYSKDLNGIYDRVASRAMSRAAGIAQIQHLMGVDSTRANELLGPEYYTAPELSHAADMERMRQEHAQMKRSKQSTDAVMQDILRYNREGKKWPGLGVRRVQDSRFDGLGVAIVLPVPMSVASMVAVPDGLPAADLHCTLAYLAEDVLPPDTIAVVSSVVSTWAACHAPIIGKLQGCGRFFAPEGCPDPVYLVPSCRYLSSAREELVSALAASGIQSCSEHGFNPHVTLAYVPRGTSPAMIDCPVDVTFSEIALWCGESRESFPLTAAPSVADLPVVPGQLEQSAQSGITGI